MSTQAAPRNDEIVGIQYLRGLAAFLVVVHHVILSQYEFAGSRLFPMQVITVGSVGVDIFFVISGVIMMITALPANKAPQAPLEFLRRRILRIYPLYWVLAAGVLALMAIGFGAKEDYTPVAIIRSLLLLPSPVVVLNYAWTLQYEMIFYAVFAIALIWGNRTVALIATSVMMTLLFVTAGFWTDDSTRIKLSNPIVFEFCLGLAVGYAYHARPDWFRPSLLLGVLAAVGAAVIVGAPWFLSIEGEGQHSSFVRIALWGGASVAIVAWAISLRRWSGRIGAFALLMGNASYALYLVHYFPVTAHSRLAAGSAQIQALPHLPMALALITIATIAGILCHLWIEKPMARMTKDLFKPAPKVSPAVERA